MKRRTFLWILGGGSAAAVGGYFLIPSDEPISDEAWLARVLPVDAKVTLDADQREMLAVLRRQPDWRDLIERDPFWRDYWTEICFQAYEIHYVGPALLP